MKYCGNCGSAVEDKADYCLRCGAKVNSVTEDKAEGLLIFASVLIPILGIILAIMNWDKSPKAARTYLIAAIISFGARILLILLAYLLSIAFTFGFAEMIMNHL